MAEASVTFADLPEAAGWDRLRMPVWLFDDTVKRHIYANAAALDLWGADSLEEFLARDCSDQSLAAQARCARLLEQTADGAEVVESWTFYPKGEPMAVEAVISTHKLPNGHAVLMFESRPAQVDNDRLRSLEALRHSPNMISMISRDGRRIFENPAAYSAFGSLLTTVEERYADPTNAQAMKDAAWAGKPSQRLLLVRTLQGERWVNFAARRTRDPAGGEDCLLVTGQDVTAQVDAEQALAAAAERATLAEEREHFLTTVSHEMRTPLNTIIGFTELMLEDATDDDQKDGLGRVVKAGRSLMAMFNEMLGAIEAEGAEPEQAENLSAEPARPLKILYADDHENNRMIVRAMLSHLGCECDLAEDGAQAVQSVQLNDYDLVLMDIQMPVMDGVEATRRIRALPDYRSRAPIVALTANTLDGQVRRYLAAGMNDCIAKPAGAHELITKIMTWTTEDWRAAADAVAARTTF